MKVERITYLKSFLKIKSKWNELLFSSGQNCIFLTHQWFYSWWKCFSENNSLEILVFMDENGNPYGIAPFMVEESSLRFIASQEVTDYCDVFSLKERREEFYENLLSYCRDNYPEGKKIELMNIKSSSPTLSTLPLLAPKYKFSFSCTETEVAPLLDLPFSYEEFLTRLSRKNRHELRRKLRRVESLEGIKTAGIIDTRDLQFSIKSFILLHKASNPSKEKFWKKKGMENFFQEIIYQFSLQKWVDLNFLFHEDRIIAALLNFSYSDKIYFYNMAYAKDHARYSPGLFLLNHRLKQAISEKKGKADFLRGGEKYKYYFGAKDSKIFHLTLILE